jgi:GNAT superfamily N-acetyltransferase
VIEIRSATKEHLPAILGLIRELAVFEREPDAVTVTDMQFRQFFDEGRFEAIVALNHAEVVGMCLFYEAYSTWKGKFLYLDDFVVTEKWRRKGVGKLLFDEVVRIACEKDAALLRWQVLDWNTPAIEFYKQYEAIIEPEWWTCKLTREQLKAIASQQ